jgi:DMSO/TMAO reductase YedYZ molybdopterin-dependent catalytic subunit
MDGLVQLDELEARDVPLHKTVGAGLDARLFSDLSALTPDALITPTGHFFVRTARPRAAATTDPWRLAISGLVARPQDVAIDRLRTMASPAGVHLIECAGNARSGGFGLISAARWDGVPLADLLALARPADAATHVLVTGVDDQAQSLTSVPGASWVFARRDLEDARAFVATTMNDAPLTPDHGAPIRLVVPGWYGCACIKWVTSIALVDATAAATGQMREFAARTHQQGVPPRAADYQPATIDLAAMPIRVERWRLPDRTLFNIVGIVWGGGRRRPPLLIRTTPREPFVPVNGCATTPAASDLPWAIWTHVWQPPGEGIYQIVLKSADPAVPTRRLDLYFYTRTVRLREL